MQEIQCPITNGIIEVDLKIYKPQDYPLSCPYCNLMLEQKGLKFHHAQIPFELREYRSSIPGGQRIWHYYSAWFYE